MAAVELLHGRMPNAVAPHMNTSPDDLCHADDVSPSGTRHFTCSPVIHRGERTTPPSWGASNEANCGTRWGANG
jgi:hypothetical protein